MKMKTVITFQDLYHNADNFKVTGLKVDNFDNLLNVMVNVNSKANDACAFSSAERIGDIRKIDVTDSQSKTGNNECWANFDGKIGFDNSLKMRAIIEAIFSYLKEQYLLPVSEQKLTNITLEVDLEKELPPFEPTIFQQAYLNIIQRDPAVAELDDTYIITEINKQGKLMSDDLGDDVQYLNTVTVFQDYMSFNLHNHDALDRLAKALMQDEKEIKAKVVGLNVEMRLDVIPDPFNSEMNTSDKIFHHTAALTCAVFELLGAKVTWCHIKK